MLSVLGSPRRLCDGFTRRELLRAGGLSLFSGLSLPTLLRASESPQARLKPGKAKSVILLYLMGGPPHQDMYDMKPAAPAEYRGEFQPASTNVPGVQICELMPRSARWMDRCAIIRSVNHRSGEHNPLPSMSGYCGPAPSEAGRFAPTDAPSMGSVCEYLGMGPRDLPAYVYLPCWLGWGQAYRRAGPYAGWLGSRFDPLFTECTAHTAQPAAPAVPQVVQGTVYLPALQPQITMDRMNVRRGLLEQLDAGLRDVDRGRAVRSMDNQYRRAFDLLTSTKVKRCFDVRPEHDKVRDRYGRYLFGESALIGRRLVEAGARFVTVTWDLFWGPLKADHDAWDTHAKNFHLLRQYHLPYFDLTFTALLEDLESRGLLDETLVVVMGEMGRTPKVNANAGRDHWTHCYSVLLAGAGIRGGAVYGSSDKLAAYPNENPVSPADICATIYELLGIPAHTMLPDHFGRPIAISHGGEPIKAIMA